MRVYLDSSAVQKIYGDVPAALRERRILENERDWQRDFRVKFLSNGNGGPGSGISWMDTDISASNRQGVLQFLAAIGAPCVDIGPEDIRTLFDGRRDPNVLAITDLLSTSSDARELLSRIEPPEIFPTLEKLTWQITFSGGEIQPLDEKVAVARMKASGIDIPDAARDGFDVVDQTAAHHAATMELEPDDLNVVHPEDLMTSVERQYREDRDNF